MNLVLLITTAVCAVVTLFVVVAVLTKIYRDSKKSTPSPSPVASATSWTMNDKDTGWKEQGSVKINHNVTINGKEVTGEEAKKVFDDTFGPGGPWDDLFGKRGSFNRLFDRMDQHFNITVKTGKQEEKLTPEDKLWVAILLRSPETTVEELKKGSFPKRVIDEFIRQKAEKKP